MNCRRCNALMYRTSLNYESNGRDNYAVLDDTVYYKCPICGHQHYLNTKSKKRTFIRGEKTKDVPVAD